MKYEVVKAFLDYEVGEVVEMEDTVAAPFLEAGLVKSAEDVGEPEAVEAPEYVANAARELTEKMDAAVVEATKKAIEKTAHHLAPQGVKIPAQVKDNTWGFKSLGDFAHCVIRKEHGDLQAARRLNGIATKATFTTGGGPTVTATDGGVLIPPEYTSDIFVKVRGVTDLLADCTEYPIQGNTLYVPVDNEAGLNSGLQTFWVDENAIIPETSPILDLVELKLKKLAVLAKVTDELLQDNGYSLDAYIKSRVPLKVIYRGNENILRGEGGGANVLNNPATVAVNRTTANRITFRDVVAMYSRMHSENLPRAAWYTSPSTFPELQSMAFDTAGTFPILSPNSASGGYPGIAGTPVATLYGRPVIMSENLSALGTRGDLLFADLSAVALIKKQYEAAQSAHLLFDRYAQCLRFVFRMQTASQWKTPWTRIGGVTASPFVVLGNVAAMAMTEAAPKEGRVEVKKEDIRKEESKEVKK